MFYINTFFIFSILGYVFETITAFLMHSNYNSGLLMGPWTSIYGFAILILTFLNYLLSKKTKGFKKIIIFYFCSVILLTILELIAGIGIEYFLHIEYWNYSAYPLSFFKYICLPVSVAWGFGSILLEYILLPLLTPWIKKIPKWISILLISLFLMDNVISGIKRL